MTELIRQRKTAIAGTEPRQDDLISLHVLELTLT
jgi:hypothetical protein